MTLILFPNLLHPQADPAATWVPAISDAVLRIDGLIAENEKEGRRFLKYFAPETFRTIPICLLNEHTTSEEIEALLQSHQCWGVISDCGLPCLADPGAQLVRLARARDFHIQAYPGPSSILLGLVLSGLPAQNFTFHGYLPRGEALIPAIRSLEQHRGTQIFIEAPYRNQKLLATLLSTLSPDTTLCLAIDLMGPTQLVLTQKVKEWKVSLSIDDHPALFLVAR